MRPRPLTWAVPAGVANALVTTVTPTINVPLTLVGGSGQSLASANCSQRRVLVTNAADETGHTLVIVGTRALDSWANTTPIAITETLTLGGIGTTESLQDFATITSITPGTAFTGNITVGTSAHASSPWVKLNSDLPAPFGVGMGVTLASGAANFDIEHTFSRLPGAVTANSQIPNTFKNSGITNKSASIDGNYAFPVEAMRLNTNSGTGTLVWEFIQAGVIGS